MNIVKQWVSDGFYFFLCRLSVAFGVFVMIGTIGILLYHGHEALSWHFLTSMWQNEDITKGGIWPAIVGSFLIGIGVLVVSFPLGLGAAIYIKEYSDRYMMRRILRVVIRNLAGVPSVIYGLFGLAFFVYYLEYGSSLLSAILTLSIMTLPWVVSTSLEALESIHDRYRENSFALGADRWQTTLRVILPMALPSSLTGGVIGVSRAMGETAPIILVGATFYLMTLPESLMDKFMALPYHTFILASQHASPDAPSYAAATAFVLIAVTFTLNFAVIMARYYYRKKEKL